MKAKEDLYDLAVDHIAEGQLDDAVRAYRSALLIDPNYADALEGLSMALADLGQWDEALTMARRVVELAPGELLSYANLSRLCQRAGRIEEAEDWAARGRMLDWKQQLKEGPPGN